MGLVGVLRELGRRRALVVVVAVCAALIGVAITYRISLPGKLESRQYHVGVASARALVDTPSSQVVDLGLNTGSDIGTLSARAQLLASLITSSPMKDEIASRAGVDPNLLVTPSSAGPPGSAPSGGASTTGTIKVSDARANVLRASVPALEAGTIPIIAIDTQAPDARSAARLADQAFAVLQAHLQNVAGTERVPEKRRVVVRELGTAASTTMRRGPSRMLAIIAALAAFLAGCGAILGLSALQRDWRRTSGDELRDRDGDGDAGAEPDAPDGGDRLRAATLSAGDAAAAVGQHAAARFAAADGFRGARLAAVDDERMPREGGRATDRPRSSEA
jgi:hypothetical protein